MKKKVIISLIFVACLVLSFVSLVSASSYYYPRYFPYESRYSHIYYYPTNYHYVDTLYLNPYNYPYYNQHFLYSPYYSYRLFVNPWRAWW